MKDEYQTPRFFRNQKELRSWFEKNHTSEIALWVGFYKKSTGIPSIDWPQSVDQALCFGWIDGIRKSVDEKSYKIRFTPRNQNSHWSKINIEKVAQLKAAGLMMPAGIKAFGFMKKSNSGKASFEQDDLKLPTELEKLFKQNKIAWKNFLSFPKWVQKSSIHWIVSAKREETILKRITTVIDCSAKGEKIALLKRNEKK